MHAQSIRFIFYSIAVAAFFLSFSVGCSIAPLATPSAEPAPTRISPTSTPSPTETPLPTVTPIPGFELLSLFIDEEQRPLTADVKFQIGNRCELVEPIGQTLTGATLGLQFDVNCRSQSGSQLVVNRQIPLDRDLLNPGLTLIQVMDSRSTFSQSILIDESMLTDRDSTADQSAALVGGRISGRVWHDLCISGRGLEREALIESGCQADIEQADGLLTPNEPGIEKVNVNLRLIDCIEGDIIQTVSTDLDGYFEFRDVQPNKYCVTVEIANQPNRAILSPGSWTTHPPADTAVHEIPNLPIGAQATGLNFGWDYQNLPRPELNVCEEKLLILENRPISEENPIPTETSVEKQWLVQNIGTCAWEPAYELAPLDQRGVVDFSRAVSIDQTVLSGSTAEFSITLFSPKSSGRWQESWVLVNLERDVIKIGILGNQTLKLNELVGNR